MGGPRRSSARTDAHALPFAADHGRLLAIRAGARDARGGRPLYFWSIFQDPVRRREILREGWREVGRIFILAVVIDIVYQIAVLHGFHPFQSVIVAFLLALFPYLFFRGLTNRLRRVSGFWR